MKSAAAVALLACGASATAPLLLGHPHRHTQRLALSAVSSSASHHHHHHHFVARASDAEDGEVAFFGDTACPCIGFDNIEGETVVEFEDGAQSSYPADLGARCESWDDGRHPACKEGATPGIGNGWCAQKWCIVDPCNCDIPVLPKQSGYIPDARYRGKPLFWSYATCGGEDMWSKELPEVGTSGCRCIGFDDVPGTTKVTIEGDSVSYPAEIGGTCHAWDNGVHPLCKQGKKSPKWCKARWCYVDPCSCGLEQPPKVTMYLPEATFTGKSLYYSYETCGSKDLFTEKYNLDACVNQESKEECLELKVKSGDTKCAWTGSKCLGWEIVEHPLCKKVLEGTDKAGAVSSRSLSALAVAAFGLGLVTQVA